MPEIYILVGGGPLSTPPMGKAADPKWGTRFSAAGCERAATCPCCHVTTGAACQRAVLARQEGQPPGACTGCVSPASHLPYLPGPAIKIGPGSPDN